MRTKYIIGLDLIRFAAALLVLWYHLAYMSWAFPDGSAGSIVAGTVKFPGLVASANWGAVGVHIFFVLSGFVIAFTADGRTAGQFLKSRILRLYPGVWVCATVSLVALLIWMPYSLHSLPVRYIKSLLLYPYPNWVDGVYWTLIVEIVFYGLVFLLLLVGQFSKLGWLLVLIGTPSVFLFSGWLVGLNVKPMLQSYGMALLLVRHGCYFALGGFIWLAWKGRLKPVFLMAALIFAATGIVHFFAENPDGAPVVRAIVWLSAMAAIIASVRYNEAATIAFGKWRPTVRILGLTTYPLYLIHQVVGASFMRFLREMGIPQLAALLGAIAFVVSLSIMIAVVLEPKVRVIMKDVIDRAVVRLPRRRAGLPAAD